MLIGGITLGLVLGLLLGGRLERLADIRLRFLPLLFVAVIVRFATEALLGAGVEIADALRVPLLGTAYGLLLFTLWHNRSYPGLALAFIGIASNALVIMWNGGYMPVWLPAYAVSGLPGPLELGSAAHANCVPDAIANSATSETRLNSDVSQPAERGEDRSRTVPSLLGSMASTGR